MYHVTFAGTIPMFTGTTDWQSSAESIDVLLEEISTQFVELGEGLFTTVRGKRPGYIRVFANGDLVSPDVYQSIITEQIREITVLVPLAGG